MAQKKYESELRLKEKCLVMIVDHGVVGWTVCVLVGGYQSSREMYHLHLQDKDRMVLHC
jgi:hypothetical protein